VFDGIRIETWVAGIDVANGSERKIVLNFHHLRLLNLEVRW